MCRIRQCMLVTVFVIGIVVALGGVASEAVAAKDDRPAPASNAQRSWTETLVPGERLGYWAFQRLERVRPPVMTLSEDGGPGSLDWCRTPVDRFVARQLAERGLTPGEPADRRTLIRRVSFDLLGLPPSVDEVERFLRDGEPAAYERLVDRMLASPHYGERWGRHWLDVARFGESDGFEHDEDRPYAYHYRDFVIRALNADMPYDRFVRWQLAGDEYQSDDPLAMMATGFLSAGVFPTQLTEREFERARYDELDDMLATTGTAMLGLTIGCARCHDHKFDPIPSADYYRLLSTFTTSVRSNVSLGFASEQSRHAFGKWEEEREKLEATIGSLKQEAAGEASDELKKLEKQLQEHLKARPNPGQTMVMVTSEGVPPVKNHADGRGYPHFYKATHFLNRGDPEQKVAVAEPGLLQVLGGARDGVKRWRRDPPEGWRTSYRRRALAEWMTDTADGAGPLLARVIVNRLWQHHLGRGIVATPNDFGVQGEEPSHPELLEWLAGRLVDGGWQLKPLHKLIMTSAVYMQSSAYDPRDAERDHDSRWLWRFEPRRLEAEAIRDTVLAVSGQLDRHMFGPGTLDEGMQRRSIYFTVKRSQQIAMLQIFDAPEPLASVARRPSTTIAPQALMLMNNPHIRGHAHRFAHRLAAASESTFADLIRRAYRVALAREPSESELAGALEFIDQQSRSYTADGQVPSRELALADFCQVLMSLNEFVYVD